MPLLAPWDLLSTICTLHCVLGVWPVRNEPKVSLALWFLVGFIQWRNTEKRSEDGEAWSPEICFFGSSYKGYHEWVTILNQRHNSFKGTFLQPRTQLPSGDFPSLHNSLILWTPVVAPQKIRITMVPLLSSWSSHHPYCFSQELPTSFKIVLIKCLLLN